ncbi:trypsin-like serine protease [Streptomyces sp. NPDC048383]|uniref:trypsin-like serine protease n=1 Tax=Streptomyces sp. NPDC048383 TaxID=3155386 RepID=UPI00343C0BA1
MEAASWPRTVEVLGAGGGCGSGTLIAPGLVLTALHVVAQAGGGPPAPGGRIRVWVLRDRQEHSVEVVWVGDRDLDAVLLSGDPRRLGRDLAPVRWGELTCSRPKVQPTCSAIGFPRAAWRTVVRPDGSQSVVHGDREVVGHVSAVTSLNAAKYDVDVSNSLAGDVGGKSGWSGLSGAGLFCNEILIGLVEAVPEAWRSRTLWALPVRRLLALPDFTAVVTTHTGITPHLESADQSPLFHAPPVPHLSPSYLLSPQAEVVPFMGMEKELTDLTSWCTSRRVVDVAVIFGPGGVGKTRLATELIRRMTQRRSPWTAGFLSDVQRASGSLESLTTNMWPLLLVLDYAETRVDQVEETLRLFMGARHTHDRVRILLLARSAQQWWRNLQMEWQGSTVMEMGTVVRLTASAAHSRAGGARNFEIATHAFRERIAQLAAVENLLAGCDEPEVVSEPRREDHSAGPAEELVVSIHMAALAQVLEHAVVPSAADVIRPVDVLLAHESRYWRHSVRSHGLDDFFHHQRDLLRELVAVQRIVGAEERRDALNAVIAAFRFHDRDFDRPQLPDREIMRRVEQMLADLYPSTDGARWGAMSPDILAAELIARADRDSDSELVVSILPDTGLSTVQQHRAMTVLARATTHQPTLTNSVARAVTAAPDILLATAVNVASELPPSDAVAWLNAIKPAATSRPNAGEHDSTDHLRRIDSLLDQLAPCSSPPAPQAPAEPTEPTEPTSMERDANPRSGTPDTTTLEASDGTPVATDRGTGEHEEHLPVPSPLPSARKARRRAALRLHFPPQAHPGAREPVPARFRLSSGAFADPRRQQRLDQALRCLAKEARKSNSSLPAVNTVLLRVDGTIELNLSTAAPAITPFRSQGADTVWRCGGDHVLPLRPETNAPSAAYPALAHLGWTSDGTITLVDLEYVGLINIEGPAKRVQPILGELAIGLTSGSRASRTQVHALGIPARDIGYARQHITQHATLQDALEATRTHTESARSALHALGFDHPRDARLHDPSNDLWKPLIILTGHQMTSDAATELGHILDARPQPCLGVVARASSSSRNLATEWTVTLDP